MAAQPAPRPPVGGGLAGQQLTAQSALVPLSSSITVSAITYSNASNALMVCVECGHPIAYIFKEYSKGNIRLSRCRKCRFVHAELQRSRREICAAKSQH